MSILGLLDLGVVKFLLVKMNNPVILPFELEDLI